MFVRASATAFLVALSMGCTESPSPPSPEAEPGQVEDEVRSCSPCAESSECGRGACAQYAGNDYCARPCSDGRPCRVGETCLALTSHEGFQIQGCVPNTGSCGSASACAGCTGNCNLLTGLCDSVDLGRADAGTIDPDTAIAGQVRADGGTVDRLYFAVVGDTRPALPNNTSGYPTVIIHSIYSEIQALKPRPQFVVSTGDFVSADPFSSQAEKQLAIYTAAMKRFDGPVFAAMGNHECATPNSINCGSRTTTSMQAFLDAMVKPLGQAKPYYSIPINAKDNSWTSKVVIVACNAWNSAQREWLETALQQNTTYTIVVRHQPSGGPCTGDVEALLEKYPYDLLLLGHIHTFSHSGKRIIVGTGGAPLDGNVPYGFVTVEQQAAGGFRITQYDQSTGLPVTSFTVP